MGNFVLVHGAFHGTWCYDRVAEQLRSEGHAVLVPQLSGVGELAHMADRAINLSTHIAEVVSQIERSGLRDFVLCGHSYAGMVITGVAGQLGAWIASLFYLDACVPKDGESLFDLTGPDVAFALLQLAGSTGTMLASPPASYFQVNEGDEKWVDRLLTPHPVATFIEKLKATGREAEIRRRTYVLCEHYAAINHRIYAELKETPDWNTVSLDRGHDLMISDPNLLTRLLISELQEFSRTGGEPQDAP